MRNPNERTVMIDEIRILLASVQARSMMPQADAESLFGARSALAYYRGQVSMGAGPIAVPSLIGSSPELLGRAAELLRLLALNPANSAPQRKMLQACRRRVEAVQANCIAAGWVAQRHDWREMQLPVGDRS